MAKRGPDKVPADERQLLILFNKLHAKIPDVDDYGSMIGDVIYDALSTFGLRSTSQQERMFEEVKCVYSGFEDLSEAMAKKEGYFPHLLTFQQKVEGSLVNLRGKFKLPTNLNRLLEVGSFKGSVLFYNLADTLVNRDGNPIDKLRRYGLGLDSLVRERGMISGNRNCMLRDYGDIYQSFVRPRGDRRD